MLYRAAAFEGFPSCFTYLCQSDHQKESKDNRELKWMICGQIISSGEINDTSVDEDCKSYVFDEVKIEQGGSEKRLNQIPQGVPNPVPRFEGIFGGNLERNSALKGAFYSAKACKSR